MDFLRKLFKNKDKPFNVNIAVLAALGVILLIMSNTLFDTKKTSVSNQNMIVEVPSEKVSQEGTYEKSLESRLVHFLEQVEGVGKVDVMLTITYGTEIVMAEDVSKSETTSVENDSAGGSRENSSTTTDSKKIIISSAQGQTPLVIKEIVPKVEGVIIVAEGGDSVLIKNALINAANTVLGVEPHKVQVLKMKK